MQRMTEFGVPRRIVAFVMPTGYSFNLDGSTLYLGVASIFVAQAAGVHSRVGPAAGDDADAADHQQGNRRRAARVAGGPLRARSRAFGLPLEGVAVILGVDELMDMARTMVNLVGNCLATAVMARWEGELAHRAGPGPAGAEPSPRASGRPECRWGFAARRPRRHEPLCVLRANSCLRVDVELMHTPDSMSPSMSATRRQLRCRHPRRCPRPPARRPAAGPAPRSAPLTNLALRDHLRFHHRADPHHQGRR